MRLLTQERKKMTEPKYALLMGNEDGNCFRPLDPGEEKNLIQVMEDYGVEKFIEKHDDDYPENWSDTEAVLIRYEVLMPKAKTTITELVIDEED